MKSKMFQQNPTLLLSIQERVIEPLQKNLQDDKKLIVEMDFREGYFVLSPQLITHWEKPYENIDIGIDEKKRILFNIREFLLTKTIPSNIVMKDI